jgi:hypothetical protein
MRPALPLLCLLAVTTFSCGRTELWRLPTDGGVDAGADAGLDAGVEDAGVVPCTPGHLTLTRAQPTVMFVIDRSGSMDTQFGFTTRWRALSQALSQALPPVDQTMAMGALVFPVQNSPLACLAPGEANLMPATGNVASLLSIVQNSSPNGATPTAASIDAAAASLRTVRAAGTARALVLATDGAPDCNSALDPLTCVCANQGRGQLCGSGQACLDDLRTVARIAAQTASGLPTYVIGIQDQADSVFVDALNQMAIAGGRPQVGADTSYYSATSPSELTQAFQTIRDQVGSCVYLTASVPDAQGSIAIFIDGVQVPFDATGAEGWLWGDRNNGELVLRGAACARAEAEAAAQLAAQVACGATP